MALGASSFVKELCKHFLGQLCMTGNVAGEIVVKENLTSSGYVTVTLNFSCEALDTVCVCVCVCVCVISNTEFHVY